jgi:hypothetical protein
VFDNRVLRRMFGSKREYVTRGWIEFHHEGLHTLYTSLYIIKVVKSVRMRWVGHRTHAGEINVYTILIRKLEGKSKLTHLSLT